ncbi:paraneoplastic antigen Ma2-like [Clarias magur]|uniref:Paraneoplastic antigen Ma2-like n=1 Tax=Clarias magur TaxID=1594786 RepID=A0A8J4U2I8_CLAMG|nr:paraneoplastic antigen Ma2-like [Clarias magur]
MPETPDPEKMGHKPPITRMQHARKQRQHSSIPAVTDSESSASDLEIEHSLRYPSCDVDEVRRHLLVPQNQSDQDLDFSEENSSLSEAEPNEPEIADQDESSNAADTLPTEDEEHQTLGSVSETSVEQTAHTSKGPENCIETPMIKRSHFETKPVIRLTYDHLGNPTEEPVTIVHHGMVIQLNLNSKSKGIGLSTKTSKPSKKQIMNVGKPLKHNRRKLELSCMLVEERTESFLGFFGVSSPLNHHPVGLLVSSERWSLLNAGLELLVVAGRHSSSVVYYMARCLGSSLPRSQ